MNRQAYPLTVLFPVLFVFAAVAAPTAHAQVLTLDKKPEAKPVQQIRLSGPIAKQKKYSFSMVQGDTSYTVKVPRGASVFMKLEKPKFDFSKGQVTVEAKSFPETGTEQGAKNQASSDGTTQSEKNAKQNAESKSDVSANTADSSSSSETEESKSKWVQIGIPQPVFLVTRFAHERQRKRIMAAEILRLNNYTLQPGDPAAVQGVDDPLVLAGKLSGTSEKAELKVGDKKYPVLLGHRNAILNGLSIATLDPDQIYLEIQGELKADGVTVLAKEIEVFARR